MTGMKRSLKVLIHDVTDFGVADHGNVVCVGFRGDRDLDAVLMIPHAVETDFFVKLLSASTFAAQQRKQHSAIEALNPVEIDGVGIGRQPDGTAVLQLQLKSQVKLDFALDRDTQQQLRTVLDAIDSTPGLASGEPHKQH